MFIDYLKPFIDWLHLNPHWAGFFVFLISFGESIAVFGLLVPGSVVMTAIGALMGAGVLPIVPMMLWAIFGAILGDIFSFGVGFYFHQRVHKIWPFTRYPQVLVKGEEFFKRHGGKSVFLGRFVGPIRPVIPLIAGTLNMKPIRFLVADIPAAIGWAPAYMLPGILLGQLSLKLQPEVASQFLLVIFGLLMVIWLIYWLLKRFVFACIAMIRIVVDKTWVWLSRYPRFVNFMQVPNDPKNPAQFRLFVFLLFLILLFSILTDHVITRGVLTHWDRPIFHFMASLQNVTAVQVMNLITFLGATKVLAGMALAVAFYLLLQRNFWALFHWILLNVFCYAGTSIVKNWVQSPRPENFSSLQYGWSFPSGHTTYAIVAFTFLAVLASPHASQFFKRWYCSIISIIVIAVGISRLYLGFHWFTDVLGGILFGLIIVSIVTFSYHHRATALIRPQALWLVAALSLLLSWSIYSVYFFHTTSQINLSHWPTQMMDAKVWWHQSSDEPPLYRTNRFGKPVQLINIQWVGDIQSIQRTLLKSGWKVPAKPDLAMLANMITNQQSSDLNPLFLAKDYHGNKPILVMTKVVHYPKYPTQRRLIILRLWDSHIFLRQNNYPIFVGTVNYHESWKSVFSLKQKNENRIPAIPAIDELQHDLKEFRVKKLVYHPAQSVVEDVDGYVLLVR